MVMMINVCTQNSAETQDSELRLHLTSLSSTDMIDKYLICNKVERVIS